MPFCERRIGAIGWFSILKTRTHPILYQIVETAVSASFPQHKLDSVAPADFFGNGAVRICQLLVDKQLEGQDGESFASHGFSDGFSELN